MNKWCFPLLLALALSACGFHLRGNIEIPTWLSNVSIISNEGDNRELITGLRIQLQRYKVYVNPQPASAKYWLVINKSLYQKQITSIGASTNPRQYLLTLSVEYTLQERKGLPIKSPKIVEVTRPLTVNNDLILGSNEEESIIIHEMRQDAIVQILNRISQK